MQVAIGTVIHSDTLTLVVREGDRLRDPVQERLSDPLNAVGYLLNAKFNLRHDDPIVYLEGTSITGPVLDEIKRRDPQSRDTLIHGLAPAFSVAAPGVRIHDRWSELCFRFRQRVAERSLYVPATLAEQLAAVMNAEDERDGKVYFDSPSAIGAKLGRYPALAVATLLATIDVPPRATTRGARAYDPLAQINRGHQPYETL